MKLSSSKKLKGLQNSKNFGKIIIISGTPGTGKTTLAKKLVKKLGSKYINVDEIIKNNKLNEFYDKKRHCWVVDVKKLNKVLTKEINNYKKDKAVKGLIIDSHLSHYLPKRYVDLRIITKCDLKTLQSRLKKKKYPKSKIRENLDCEIFDICLNEAIEAGHKVIVIQTTKPLNINKIAKKLK